MSGKAGTSSDQVDGLRVSREVDQDAPVTGPRPVHQSDSSPFIPRPDGFDMEIVSVNFEKCLETDEVNMEQYILAYRELERFFELMGSVFGYIGADIKDKLEILHKHTQSPAEKSSYATVKQMMIYETALPHRLEPLRTFQSHELPSASRTLLRLHRALEFIMMLMNDLIVAQDHDPVSHIAQNVYKESLAKYHGWFIRKGAHLAMYTLPSKVGLMEKVSKHKYGDVEVIAKRMVLSMKPVYEKTQDLYTEFKLHELP